MPARRDPVRRRVNAERRRNSGGSQVQIGVGAHVGPDQRRPLHSAVGSCPPRLCHLGPGHRFFSSLEVGKRPARTGWVEDADVGLEPGRHQRKHALCKPDDPLGHPAGRLRRTWSMGHVADHRHHDGRWTHNCPQGGRPSVRPGAALEASLRTIPCLLRRECSLPETAFRALRPEHPP
jgi:hypothetical protein